MVLLTSRGSAGTRRVMVFIDGGYLRKNTKDIFNHDVINYEKLVDELRRMTSYGNLFPELIRAYYYDAKLKAEDADMFRVNNGELDTVDMELAPEYEKRKTKLKEQEEYLQKMNNTDYFQIRLGQLKIDGKGNFRQKGVDTLISIDMISKAYEDHYDVAVLLAGDEDLLEVVNAVKNAGKRVFGAYFENHISSELQASFDKRFPLNKEFMKSILPAYKQRE